MPPPTKLRPSKPTQFDNPRTLTSTTKNLVYHGAKIWRIPKYLKIKLIWVNLRTKAWMLTTARLIEVENLSTLTPVLQKVIMETFDLYCDWTDKSKWNLFLKNWITFCATSLVFERGVCQNFQSRLIPLRSHVCRMLFTDIM